MGVETYHYYSLTTNPDGSIEGRAETNDNLDRGYPTEFADWPVKYRDEHEMLRRTGGTHIGINGCQVTVILDGQHVFPASAHQGTRPAPSQKKP